VASQFEPKSEPMRRLALTTAVLAPLLAPAVTRADHEPVIVIPTRPGVPIMINGRDASYAVVEGDWGLAQRIHVQPVVTYGWWDAYGKPPPAHYFPRTGRRPDYGRLELMRNRPLPPPAEGYYRDWTAQSPAGAVTEYPPFDPPPVIVAPRDGRRPHPHPHR
jgi:hypothetical protein